MLFLALGKYLIIADLFIPNSLFTPKADMYSFCIYLK